MSEPLLRTESLTRHFKVGKLLSPVSKLLIESFALEPTALPLREIRILNR